MLQLGHELPVLPAVKQLFTRVQQNTASKKLMEQHTPTGAMEKSAIDCCLPKQANSSNSITFPLVFGNACTGHCPQGGACDVGFNTCKLACIAAGSSCTSNTTWSVGPPQAALKPATPHTMSHTHTHMNMSLHSMLKTCATSQNINCCQVSSTSSIKTMTESHEGVSQTLEAIGGQLVCHGTSPTLDRQDPPGQAACQR
jgi:hypothetical protein